MVEYKYYSQFGQDAEVAKFFKFRRNGYFIDVGAADGELISNTYMLEKQLGWKGICVEPYPDQFKILQQKRSCMCLQAAVYKESDLDFVLFDGLSGIVDHIYNKDILNNKEIIKTKTQTLTDIMDEHGAPSYIEYLSIDTEGSELEVLNGIDWSRYSFGYIGVEHNFVKPIRENIRKLLEGKGYIFLRENSVDDDYVLTMDPK